MTGKAQAPDRIWACPDGDTWEAKSGPWYISPDHSGPEAKYIRADLVPDAKPVSMTDRDKLRAQFAVAIVGAACADGVLPHIGSPFITAVWELADHMVDQMPDADLEAPEIDWQPIETAPHNRPVRVLVPPEHEYWGCREVIAAFIDGERWQSVAFMNFANIPFQSLKWMEIPRPTNVEMGEQK